MNLGLVITDRCNAACAHCSTSCGPSRTAALTADQVKDLMNQAVALSDGDAPTFGITGGEPFLDFDQLLELVAHGTVVGGRVTCMTNAYWATSDDKARAMLVALKRAGLRTLGVSTSRFHERFVSRERVKRALRLAREAGIVTALKCALTESDRSDIDGLEPWARRAGADFLELFPVLPYIREGEAWPEAEFSRQPGLPEGTCPAPQVTVRPNGMAYTCCHPGATGDFHSLGNAADGLASIRDAFHLGGKLRILRDRGPAHFARAIQQAGKGSLLRNAYASVCDLCAHVAAEPELAAVAETVAKDYERRYLEEIFAELARLAPA